MRTGEKPGFALSIVILLGSGWRLLSPLPLPKTELERVKTIALGLNLMVKHQLLLVPTKDLRMICEQLVAKFDSEFLEESRMSWDAMREHRQ